MQPTPSIAEKQYFFALTGEMVLTIYVPFHKVLYLAKIVHSRNEQSNNVC